MNQVNDVVNFNLVANVTKFLHRSLYLILAAALASAALVCAAPAYAQEGPARTCSRAGTGLGSSTCSRKCKASYPAA